MSQTTTKADDGSRALSTVETQEVKDEGIIQVFKTDGVAAQNLAGNGFTYRHDWGNRHGQWKLNLNWGAVNCNSRVFVSASEFGGGNQCDFIGGARYTVHNVAPHQGGVTVWLDIAWNSPIRVHLDYLVINP